MRRSLALCLIILAACSDQTTGNTLSATGSWVGTLNSGGGSGTLALTLTQSGGSVAGSASFTVPNDPPPGIGTVTGSVSGTTVTLTIQPQPQVYMGQTVDANESPLQFVGALTATTMVGTVSGGGKVGSAADFVNIALTLTRP